jgi:hypothetical protein
MRPSEEELAKIAAAVPGDEFIWEHSNTWDRVAVYERATVTRTTATRIVVKSESYNEIAFHKKSGRCVGSDRYNDHLRLPEGEVLEREKAYRRGLALAKMRERTAGDIYRMSYDEVLAVFEFIEDLKAKRQSKKGQAGDDKQ